MLDSRVARSHEVACCEIRHARIANPFELAHTTAWAIPELDFKLGLISNSARFKHSQTNSSIGNAAEKQAALISGCLSRAIKIVVEAFHARSRLRSSGWLPVASIEESIPLSE